MLIFYLSVIASLLAGWTTYFTYSNYVAFGVRSFKLVRSWLLHFICLITVACIAYLIGHFAGQLAIFLSKVIVR